MRLIVDWYDCFFLDWVLFANLKAARLPGTEDMDKAYHQKRYHVIRSLWGMFVGLISYLLALLIFASIYTRPVAITQLTDIPETVSVKYSEEIELVSLVVNFVIGCCDRDEEENVFYGVTYTLPVLIHEFNHSFCNPLNEEFWDEIVDSAAKFFKPERNSITP